MYQFVFMRLRLLTMTSRLTPRTDWANQSGNVSLSPFVIRTAPSEQLSSRLIP